MLVILQILTIQQVFAKNLLRWEDNQGNIFYSDKITPGHVDHRRETLNENARIVEVLEAKKTKAQRELEARLAVLRKEQEKIIAKQRTQDKVLLSTYRSIEDIDLALKNKLGIIDSQQKVAKGNLNRLEKQLTAQHKKAAGYERDGKPAPKKLVDSIKSTENQIQLSYSEISKFIKHKREITKAFETNKKRFTFLTGTDTNTDQVIAKSASVKAADKLGLFSCQSQAQCTKAWSIARQFIKDFSTISIDFDSEALIMSGRPFSDKDLSLSISKMRRKNKAPDIFLDIRCRESSLGKELCKSHKALYIRASFRPYIVGALE